MSGHAAMLRPDLRVGARGLLVRFVLERQAKPYAVAGHRAVLNGHVLTHNFGDAQIPHGSGGGRDRVAGCRFPRLATGSDNVGDPVNAVRHPSTSSLAAPHCAAVPRAYL